MQADLASILDPRPRQNSDLAFIPDPQPRQNSDLASIPDPRPRSVNLVKCPKLFPTAFTLLIVDLTITRSFSRRISRFSFGLPLGLSLS